MADLTLQSRVAKAAESSSAVARLVFIDHWRAALTILVVLHHIGVVYSAAAPYYYVDPPPAQSLGALALFVFVLFNQAWFMGAFFLLAGYFTPGSFDRRGARAFVSNRLLRLGLPLLLFAFVLGPLSDIGLYLDPAPLIPTPFTWDSFWELYPQFIGLGVAWFLALLLIFDLGYTAWRLLAAGRPSATPPALALPTYATTGLFILVLALVSTLWRIPVPLGREIVGFPTLAYLPEYLSFFVIGILAARGDWLRTLPAGLGKAGFLVAVLASLLLFPPAIASILTTGAAFFMGGGTWQSAAYALWDASFAVGLSLATLTFFRRYLNTPSRLGRFLARQSYAVYIIHTPLVVLVSYGLYLLLARAGLALGPLLKFGLASLICVPLCFAVAALLRAIPGVARVL